MPCDYCRHLRERLRPLVTGVCICGAILVGGNDPHTDDRAPAPQMIRSITVVVSTAAPSRSNYQAKKSHIPP
jgi:hypothetical protein